MSKHRGRRWWQAGLVGLLVMLAALSGRAATDDPAQGFAVPQPGRDFVFPRDHGSHPEFRVEWWYVTGHLYTAERARFGFQATFFRQAAPGGDWHVHLAHMGVVEIASGRFLHQERLDRAGWDAGAATDGLDLHHGPWSLRMTDAEREVMELRGGVAGEARFELTLRPAKPLVIFGENGVSRKGADPTAASHYLTFTRLTVEGRLEWRGTKSEVSGEAWMDHEISSSQLSAGQVGWDWVSMQLNDGREVMLYRLRRADGSADPASTLTWIAADATLHPAPFDWEVLEEWRSPETGAVYPARIRIRTKDPENGAAVTLQVEPLVPGQELPGDLSGIPYWEGACRVRDAQGREIGSAYMELTGYARALAF